MQREAEAAAFIARAVEHFGALHTLVNNVGIRLYHTVPEASEESWDTILGVNLKSYAFCAKFAIPILRNADGASIVNMASNNAFIAGINTPQYDTTKAAVAGLTRALARAHADEGIRVNVTLCFSPTQALLAAKAGAAYISPFVGRLDDISYDGMELIAQILAIYQNYGFPTEVLVASIRHPKHILDAALMGADVVTVPYKAFDAMFNHPLTDKGLAAFLADWEEARETVAPKAVEP